MAIFALSAAALYSPVGASAQDAQPIEQPPEPPPLIARPPAEIGDETGEVGLPGGFFIEFGDKNDWIQFKAGEWLMGDHQSQPRMTTGVNRARPPRRAP